VYFRAGSAWRSAGLVADAAPLFERALRFVPDDPEALRGLGAALVEEGRRERGAALLARAVDLAEERGQDVHPHLLDLARALAERIADRPAAIARIRSIPSDAREAADARALEGRWRAELGDLAGASLAFARLRERAETFVDATLDDAARRALVAYLSEAARFEREVQRDPLAAQRHLATALRLAPRDPAIGDAYRAVGAAIAESARGGRAVVEEPATPAPRPAAAADPYPAAPAPAAAGSRPRAPKSSPGAAPAAAGSRPRAPKSSPGAAPATATATVLAPPPGDAVDAWDPIDREARADELARRIQLDPSDDAVADELTAHLLALGRGHELLALLSARIEDASPERAAVLVPKRLAALQRLEENARARGDHDEADLFAMLRAGADT